ncbi:MAG: hypothetical protein JWQ36_187 [Enterovirga sp.]|nr:hypothetical protein [Enterovirga sp.]
MDLQHQPTFEWDEDKAALNIAKHGVSFEAAIQVFADPERLEEVDRRRDYGEARFNTIGVVDGFHLTVTWTPRRGVARIISARRASREERERYGHHP